VKSDQGSVARVTKGKVNRRAVTRDAVMMALAPFVSPKLYEAPPPDPGGPVVEFRVLDEDGGAGQSP